MWMWTTSWLACATIGAPEVVALPNPARTGEAGLDGPYGAAVVSMAAPARVTEVVPVDVIYPHEQASLVGDAAPAVQGAPVVVFVHGGLVAPERYRWLGTHFATRGFVTVMPRAELDLAIAQPGNGGVALDALRREAASDGLLAGIVDADGPSAAMGHSLGGVLAARQWLRDDEIDLLVMLASYPAASDVVEDEGSRPVLAISGTTDQSLEVDQYLAESERYADDAAVWLATGLNHYGWTDGATPSELAGDGPLEGDLPELRRRVLALIDAHLDVALRNAGPEALEGPFEGLERAP